MTILFHFRTRGTGPEAVHIAGVATAFERLGHRVVFSSPTGIDPRQTAGTNPYQKNGKWKLLSLISLCCPGVVFELLEIGYNVVAWRRNKKILKSEDVDFIYERHALFLASTAWLSRSYDVPLVVEVNEMVGDDRVRKQPWLGKLARSIDRFVFSRAAVIVVVSPHLKRRIQALGIPENKIVVLPNAVDADTYAQQVDGSVMRQRLGLNDMIVVGFVGWFVDWHRLDLLLEAFAQLVATHPALRLVLVGDGPLRASLQDRIRRLGVASLVDILGALPYPEIPAIIGAMDICVVPNSNEYRSPLKLFEYMGQGKLVIAPSTEPVLMVIRHGENGLLFKPENLDSLVEVFARALDDAGLRRRVGEQARRDVLAKHTWQSNVQAVLSALSDATHGPFSR